MDKVPLGLLVAEAENPGAGIDLIGDFGDEVGIRFVGAKGVEEAAGDGGDAGLQVEALGQAFASQLAQAVDVEWTGGMGLWDRVIGNGVNGCGGGEENAAQAGASFGRIQDPHGAMDIDVGGPVGVFVAPGDEVDRGEVDDPVGIEIPHCLVQSRSIQDVEFEEMAVRQVDEVPVAEGKVVDDQYFQVMGLQFPDEGGADEAGATGDEDFLDVSSE